MRKAKKKDVKKKDAKKRGGKAEDSLDHTASSSSTTLPDLHFESRSEEILKGRHEEPEEPLQPLPPFHEERALLQMIMKSYEGEQVDGFYEGEGILCFEGGNTYKGLFSEGCMNGQGIYTWDDGVKFEGMFVKNMPTLNGCYTWSDGSVYEGSIKDGLRHGFGIFRSGTRPVSYVGDWCNGKRHGKGVIYYNEERTSWYSGEWVNNVKEGWGMRRYRSGNTYEGQWEKNLRHGHGKMIWVTANEEYIGEWACGVQHGYGTYRWFLHRVPPSQCPLRNEYVGDFVNGERHGRGMFVYAGGAVYRGEWVCNKKHGKGTFVLKDGSVFEREFVDDHPVKYPADQGAAVGAKKQRAFRRRKCCPENNTIINALGKSSALGSDIELDISLLLGLLPVEERKEELKQVELAVLKHIADLKDTYHFYSLLGCIQSLDNTYILTKLQFWRFLKDCEFHLSFKTLAEIDRLLRGDRRPEDIHCPHEVLLFRTFLSYLVHLAFHMYHEEPKGEVPHLDKYFLEMMSRNVLPSARCVRGILFSCEEFTDFAMSYIDKCWEIYRYFCRPYPRPPFEPTMRMRQFIWMLDEFKLLSEQLTVARLSEILVKVGSSLPDVSSVNLDLELVFLEFFEALLECALVYVTYDMIPEEVAQENLKRTIIKIKDFSMETSAGSLHSEPSPPQLPAPCEDSTSVRRSSLLVSEALPSFPAVPEESKDDVLLLNEDVKKEQDSCPEKELTDEAKEDKDEQEEDFGLWICQVQTFFTTKLFPAFQHELVLREKMKEKEKEDEELAELRKIEAEELARLIAEKEEEAKRREAAAAEAALAAQKEDMATTPKGKLRRRGALSKKGAARKGLSPRKSLLPKKEAPKTESEPRKEAQEGSRA